MTLIRLAVLALALSFPATSFAQEVDSGTPHLDGGVVVMPELPVIAPMPTFQSPDGGFVVGEAEQTFVVSMAKGIKYAVTTKSWGWLVFLIITALVALTRGVLAPRIPVLQHKLAGMILAFLWSGAGALATTWGAGEALTGADILTALSAGFVAMGGWSALKALLEHFMPDGEGSNWATVIGGIFGIKNPKLPVTKEG